MVRKNRTITDHSLPRVNAAEQLLMDELPKVAETRILCTSLGRGQFAAEAARQVPGATVECHFLDVYLAEEARREIQSGAGGGDGSAAASRSSASAVDVTCSSDFSPREVDLAAIPVDPRGDGELARDLLQSAHDRLMVGGRLLSATSNPDDQWLHDELRKMFPRVTRRPLDEGVLYLATKTGPIRKHKEFTCEFAFRDGERLIRAMSRPGVFSHRSLDGGARALINVMQVREGARILDLGSGSGVVGFAAALRAANVQVVAIDSCARAVECTLKGAELNEIHGLSARLTAGGDSGAPGTFDLAVGNPPYYSDYRIAEIFLQGALGAVRPGGTILMVTKTPAWFSQRMGELFAEVQAHQHKSYTVVEARRGRK